MSSLKNDLINKINDLINKVNGTNTNLSKYFNRPYLVMLIKYIT